MRMETREVQQLLLEAAAEAAKSAKQIAAVVAESMQAPNQLSAVAQAALTLVDAARLVGETAEK
jgi:hypothetical protein